jgi:hypothetical protein
MEINDQFLRRIIGEYFKTEFSKVMPEIIRDACKNNSLFIGQDLIAIDEVIRRYSLSRRTLYNYHHQGFITLCSSNGKTFLSVKELENHIRNHPLARNVSNILKTKGS